ncbi:MAG: tetratricopeptide repeat protein [Cyclobacteriaceae bacterium]
MRFNYFTFIFLFSFSMLLAQTSKINSLKNAIAISSNERERADLNQQLAEKMYSYDFEKGFEYAKRSLELATEANYSKGIAQALTSIGTYYYYKGDINESLKKYKQALTVIKAGESKDYPIRTFLRMSILYRQQAKFDSAKICLSKVEALLQNQEVGDLHGALYASKGILLNELSKNIEALQFLKKSLKIRFELHDTVRLADTWRNMGKVYSILSIYDSAEFCFNQADLLISKIDEPEIHMLVSLSRGETNFAKGNLNKSIANYNEALKQLKVNNYKRYYSYLLYKIGELYENQGFYNIAYDYLFEALKEFEVINSRQDIARVYSQIGWCYNYQENYQQAIEHASKSLVIAKDIGDSLSIAQNMNLIGYALLKAKKYDEALLNLKEALSIRKKIKHSWGVTYTLYNMALVYLELSDQKKALDLLYESLEINKRIGNRSGYVFVCNELGLIYTKDSQFTKALTYLKEANQIARQIPLPAQLRANYKNYIFLFERKKDDRNMIRYYKLYSQLEDSLNQETSTSRISKADAFFQLQKKAAEIQLINRENELHQEKIKSQNAQITFQRRIILIVVTGLIILIAMLIIIYRLLKGISRAREVLKQQNIEILKQKEEILAQSEELTDSNNKLHTLNTELTEKNDEIELQSERIKEVNSSLEKRVNERTNQLNLAYGELETFFYRTSHDFRRPLTTYLGLVEIAKISLKDQTAIDLFDKVRETTEGLDNMLIKLQSISNTDYEDIKTEIHFLEFVNKTVDGFKNKIKEHKIKIMLDIDVDRINTNEQLLRVAFDNLIENAVNFCTPIDPWIKIKASCSKTTLHVIIEDNGQGISDSVQHRVFEMYFRGNDNSKGNGLGLYIAKRSIEKIGGTISFSSRFKEGSSFSLSIPLNI